MKLGKVVVHMGTTTSPSFIKIGWKTKKVLLIAHLTDVSSIKVSLSSCYGAGDFYHSQIAFWSGQILANMESKVRYVQYQNEKVEKKSSKKNEYNNI